MMAIPPPQKIKKAQTSKYPQLVAELTARIQSGQLAAGQKLPTFVELQQAFSVTPHTVNRAMIALEHSGLIERRRGSGVSVAHHKKPRSRTNTIGLCGLGFGLGGASSYWLHLLEGVHRGVEDSGAQILLLKDIRGEGWEKVDGVIVSGWADAQYIDQILSTIPLVCLFVTHPQRASVTADEYSGAKAATEHLLELGHRRIAFLHSENSFSIPPRLRGYEDALREAGIAPRQNWRRVLSGKNEVGAQFSAAGRRDLTSWITEGGRNNWKKVGCTALLCHNDETAVGALQALKENGLRVPDDVSVVGFDGTDIGEYSSPRLTSVEIPLHQIGKAAVGLLERQIEADEVLVEHKILPTQLRVRESTAAPSRL